MLPPVRAVPGGPDEGNDVTAAAVTYRSVGGPATDPPTGGLGPGDGLFGAELSGGLGAVRSPTSGWSVRREPTDWPKVEAVASRHYPKAGDQLSGHASWWVVVALSALFLAAWPVPRCGPSSGRRSRAVRPWRRATTDDLMTAVDTPARGVSVVSDDPEARARHRRGPDPVVIVAVGLVVLVVLLAVFEYWVTGAGARSQTSCSCSSR